MGVFQNRKFRSSAESGTFAARYRAMLAKRPFLLFGLPFMTVIIAGSFILTPATAIRYERHDRRVRQMSREEELGVGKQGRRVDMREEYYRLAAKDIENWEQKRVERLKGENDGVL
ncbi:cytochrome c oxidase assembly protein COX16-domain-containing protein [Cercophora newfieldiana]|uniref:Cytochrome c oxidase assembly protein COX16, mitochondrial n=1 Tax=Cercophora newfieldiana TaxID=92897 RepID=A0AA39YQ96_9PEZI|nr:cytochrome c oxidase assembly protein COX16-domain-containing protein [Cercophora newfieldiana]